MFTTGVVTVSSQISFTNWIIPLYWLLRHFSSQLIKINLNVPLFLFFPSIYFTFPTLLFIIFKCILFSIRFLCEVKPDERWKLHIGVSHLAITPHMENQKESKRENPDGWQHLDWQLTLFTNRYKSTFKLIKYKEFDITSSFDFVIPQCYYELCTPGHIYSLVLHESSLKVK